MFFRNLTLFRFAPTLDLSDLENHLSQAALKPVGPLDLSSRGFIPPFGRDTEALSHQRGKAIWVSVGSEEKLLPGAVVNDMLQKRLESGKQVTRLALTLDDHVSFVLGEDLVLRKYRILDGAVDTLETTEREDLRAELDARFALMAGELERLFSVLEPALKISRLDG